MKSKYNILKLIVAVFLGALFICFSSSEVKADQWYNPFPGVSNNIKCKVGKPFNLANGNCYVDWSVVAGNVANNIGSSFGDLHNPLP